MKKRVCIFCAASDKIPQIYFDETKDLTQRLVDKGFSIVYGGGSKGLMGQVAETTLEMQGEITGVIPQFMINLNGQHSFFQTQRNGRHPFPVSIMPHIECDGFPLS